MTVVLKHVSLGKFKENLENLQVPHKHLCIYLDISDCFFLFGRSIAFTISLRSL